MTLPLERLANYPGALAWNLLGSAARNQLRPDSDVDLAVLPHAGCWIDREVLVRWGGVLVWTADQGLSTKRTSELLAQYLTFQDDRKDVLNAYRA